MHDHEKVLCRMTEEARVRLPREEPDRLELGGEVTLPEGRSITRAVQASYQPPADPWPSAL
eukprot:4441187-Lingulodinium_polyedra.AAC.1